MRFGLPTVILILSIASRAIAGFTVSSWNLSTIVQESAGTSVVQDIDRILNLANPLLADSNSLVLNNHATAHYDHSWIPELAYGDFNTSFEHQIRSPEVRTTTTAMIFIETTEPLRIAIDGMMNYSHTPGDLDSLNFFATVRDESTFLNLYREQEMTGGLFFEPSSGMILFNGEVVVQPGTYRLRYGLDSTNTGDLLPTGTMDATGYVNFAVRPVPEPATAVFLLGLIDRIRQRRPKDES